MTTLINLIVVIISQCIYVHEIITLYTLNTFVNYTPIRLEEERAEEKAVLPSFE